jgi:hypothetical protein
VAQKGKQSLPEDGIVLPKHVGAIVKDNKEVYNFSSFSWLISTWTTVFAATGLPVTENTRPATRAVTGSTVCVKSPIDRITVTFPLLVLKDRETNWRQQNHRDECERDPTSARRLEYHLVLKYLQL